LSFEESKWSKKAKVKEGDEDIVFVNEDDINAMSEFEREVTNGWFLLEKK